MDGFHPLDLWDMFVEVFHSSSHQAKGPKQQARWDLQRIKPSGKHTNTQIKTQMHHNDLELSNVDYVSLRTLNLLVLAPCFTFLKKMKRWSRWSSKAEVQQWDTCPEPTKLRLIGNLTESTWTQKIRIKYVDTKKPTLRHTDKGATSHVMSGTIFSVCSISAFQLCQLPSNNVEQDTGKNKRRKENGEVKTDVELGFEEYSNQNDTASSSKVWQTDAKTNASAVRPAAEGSGIVNVDSVWPNNFQISVDYVPYLEKVYPNLRQKNWSQFRRRHERLRCEFVDVVNVCVCNVGCSNSSWKIYLENVNPTKKSNER